MVLNLYIHDSIVAQLRPKGRLDAVIGRLIHIALDSDDPNNHLVAPYVVKGAAWPQTKLPGDNLRHYRLDIHDELYDEHIALNGVRSKLFSPSNLIYYVAINGLVDVLLPERSTKNVIHEQTLRSAILSIISKINMLKSNKGWQLTSEQIEHITLARQELMEAANEAIKHTE